MTIITYNTKTLKCIEKEGSIKTQTSYKTLALLMEDYNMTKDFNEQYPSESAILKIINQ